MSKDVRERTTQPLFRRRSTTCSRLIHAVISSAPRTQSRGRPFAADEGASRMLGNEQVDREEGDQEDQRADRITDDTVEDKRGSCSGFIAPWGWRWPRVHPFKNSWTIPRGCHKETRTVPHDTQSLNATQTRGQLQLHRNEGYDFEQHCQGRSRNMPPDSGMCHRIQEREHVNSVGALMTALTQKAYSSRHPKRTAFSSSCVLAVTCRVLVRHDPRTLSSHSRS